MKSKLSTAVVTQVKQNDVMEDKKREIKEYIKQLKDLCSQDKECILKSINI